MLPQRQLQRLHGKPKQRHESEGVNDVMWGKMMRLVQGVNC